MTLSLAISKRLRLFIFVNGKHDKVYQCSQKTAQENYFHE